MRRIMIGRHVCSQNKRLWQKSLSSSHRPTEIGQATPSTLRWFGSPDASSSSSSNSLEEIHLLRVAVVGGGVAGMTTALHLAPLVKAGILAGPIDVYEATSGRTTTTTTRTGQSHGPGAGAVGRSIGVGIWSTALESLKDHHTVDSTSQTNLLRRLTHMGRWVGGVGYRTPNGAWLAESHLNDQWDSTSSSSITSQENSPQEPALLFLREQDLLQALRTTVQEEVQRGTIQLHYSSSADKEKDSSNSGVVERIEIPSITSGERGISARLGFANGSLSPEAYHLIVAADGMHSKLRTRYAGHFFGRALSSPISDEERSRWDAQENLEANAMEHRNYIVLRGNAPLTNDELGMDGTAFQTWGEGNSMRFASVPMSYPRSSDGDNHVDDNERVEEQVWFVTTSDKAVWKEPLPERRKQMILDAFDSWHDPIRRLIKATPATDILMDQAVAHKHSVGPVLNLYPILRQQNHDAHKNERSTMMNSVGRGEAPGPALMFVGDASMTVDPVLAQGFTLAMEDAHALAVSLQKCCHSVGLLGSSSEEEEEPRSIARLDDGTRLNFDPQILREELRVRHGKRGDRLLCLLRATELVQSMAQPHSGTVGGFLSRRLIRPFMQITPNTLKRHIFNSMMKYSLGLSLFSQKDDDKEKR